MSPSTQLTAPLRADPISAWACESTIGSLSVYTIRARRVDGLRELVGGARRDEAGADVEELP